MKIKEGIVMILVKALRTLFAYLVIGLIVGVWFTPLLPWVKKNNYAFRIWFSIDVMVCTVAHGTYRRTISGWSGQFMSTKPRYRKQAKVIDLLLRLCGDTADHCLRAYQWELKQGLVE